MKHLYGGALVACLISLMPQNATALDISDFLEMQTARTWEVEGTALYAGQTIGLSGTITTQVIPSLFVPEENSIQLTLFVQGGSYTIVQDLFMRLTDTDLLLERRVGSLSFSGFPIDSDTETYLTPAAILPRQFELNRLYEYTADLETGPIPDSIYISTFMPKTTAQGWEIEALMVNFFLDGGRPLNMWIGRDTGIVEIQVEMDAGGLPIAATLMLVGDGDTWNPQPGTGLWGDTTNLGGGWRSSDAFGDIWAPSIDSPWVNHTGLGWAYCVGNEGSLHSYIPGVNWMWTQSGLYPHMYVYNRNGWLYYSQASGSHTFWDFTLGQWVVLSPVP